MRINLTMKRVKLSLPLPDFELFLLNISQIHIVDQILDSLDHAVKFNSQLSDLIPLLNIWNRLEVFSFDLLHMLQQMLNSRMNRTRHHQNNKRWNKKIDRGKPYNKLTRMSNLRKNFRFI